MKSAAMYRQPSAASAALHEAQRVSMEQEADALALVDFDHAVRVYLAALTRFDGQPRAAAEVAESAGESVGVFVLDGAEAGE